MARDCLATPFDFMDPDSPKARALRLLQPVLFQVLKPIHCLFYGKPVSNGFSITYKEKNHEFLNLRRSVFERSIPWSGPQRPSPPRVGA